MSASIQLTPKNAVTAVTAVTPLIYKAIIRYRSFARAVTAVTMRQTVTVACYRCYRCYREKQGTVTESGNDETRMNTRFYGDFCFCYRCYRKKCMKLIRSGKGGAPCA